MRYLSIIALLALWALPVPAEAASGARATRPAAPDVAAARHKAAKQVHPFRQSRRAVRHHARLHRVRLPAAAIAVQVDERFASTRAAAPAPRAMRVARASRPSISAHHSSALSIARAIGAPGRYIAGRLTCAINVNAALAERGIRGTGSALAKSFLNWGRQSAPVPGAVAVYDRGGSKGHAAIVSRVEGAQVYVWNPGRGGWREVVYPKQAIAYRIGARS